MSYNEVLRHWQSDETLPEFQCIFAAVFAVVLHVVEETKEILQALKADLITHRDTQMRHKSSNINQTQVIMYMC